MDENPKCCSEDIGKLLLRLSIGGLMLFHGIDKAIHGLGSIFGILERNGLPSFLAYGVLVGELVAPVLILLGWLTRLAALVVALTMATAVYLALRDQVFTLNQHGGWAIELNALFFLGALALVFLGAGRYSLFGGRSCCD